MVTRDELTTMDKAIAKALKDWRKHEDVVRATTSLLDEDPVGFVDQASPIARAYRGDLARWISHVVRAELGLPDET